MRIYAYRYEDAGQDEHRIDRETFEKILSLVSPTCRDSVLSNTDPSGVDIPDECKRELQVAVQRLQGMAADTSSQEGSDQNKQQESATKRDVEGAASSTFIGVFVFLLFASLSGGKDIISITYCIQICMHYSLSEKLAYLLYGFYLNSSLELMLCFKYTKYSQFIL